jgi:hypothetical protein
MQSASSLWLGGFAGTFHCLPQGFTIRRMGSREVAKPQRRVADFTLPKRLLEYRQPMPVMFAAAASDH